MNEPDTSGQRIDDAAEAAVGTDDDAAAARTDLADRSGVGSPEPGQPADALDDQADVPATEGNRQLVETVRSIERLEESN